MLNQLPFAQKSRRHCQHQVPQVQATHKTVRVVILLFWLCLSAYCFGLRLFPDLSTAQAAAATRQASVTLNNPVFHLPEPLRADLPFDVNIEMLRQLSSTPQKSAPPFDIPANNLAYAQRLFDVYAWQAFLALNWPATLMGAADPKKTLADSAAPRVWESYVEIGRVFREDGAPPLPWSEAVKDSWEPTKRVFWIHGMGVGKREKDAQPLLDESLQAFTGPFVDQQGKWVRYQAVMNRTEYDYLVEHKLYNLEGQAAFTARNKIEFPANVGTSQYGAIELKFSWKQLAEDDDPSRFFVRQALVKPLTGQPFSAKFALVGMHIAARTASSPSWIWATFEHVDNTAANDLEKDPRGRPRRPTFFNPDNPTKPVNVLAAKNTAPNAKGQFTSWDEAQTTNPTQATMVLPIPKSTAALNAEARALLAKLGSVFQYYELIGAQWPMEPSFPAFPNGVAAQSDGSLLPSAPESILYKVPGKVVPVYLGNSTMETFFQAGNQVAGPLAEDDRLPPGQFADPSTVFGTESCAGCHFSAGACIGFKRDSNGRFLVETRDGKNYRIPIYGKNASRGLTGGADYSWLLQLRAQQAPYTGTDIAPLSSVLVKPSSPQQ